MMLDPMGLHPRWRRLGWSALAKVVLSCAAAVGSRIGEKLADTIFDDDDEEGDEPEVKEGSEE